jgi:hypothetical protein
LKLSNQIKTEESKLRLVDIVDGANNFKEGRGDFRVNVSPPYQRKKSWTDKQVTAYMQTLLFFQNLSGHFFLEKVTDENGIVVHNVCDGQNRLGHGIDFVENKTKISSGKVVYNPEGKENPDYQIAGFDGEHFMSLPMEVKEALLGSELSVTILDGDKYPGVGRFVFDALNSCSCQINKQEQRNAMWHSELTAAVANFVSDCFANTPIVKKAMSMTFKNISRMTMDKYMLMGVCIMKSGVQKKKRTDAYVEKIMKDFLAPKMKELSCQKRKKMANSMLADLESAIEFWGYVYEKETEFPFSDRIWWTHGADNRIGTKFAPTTYAILLRVFVMLKKSCTIEINPLSVTKGGKEVKPSRVRDSIWGIMNKHLNYAANGEIPLRDSKELFRNSDTKVAVEKRWKMIENIATDIFMEIVG